jgi:solute carrier family 13 (sodium-dependent dicarboxylate transporter), member 2/3/5
MGTDRRGPHPILRHVLAYLNFERVRPGPPPERKPSAFPAIKLLWFLAGVAGGVWIATQPGIPDKPRAMLAVALPMSVWWITEAIPISITALLPLVALPVLGLASARDAAAPYADPNVFLFIGGFILASCLQKWGLHKRLALLILLHMGSSPRRILLACMGVTAFISMWASNTATVLMMYPIALALVDSGASADEDARHRFATSLLLGIAYAASLGGMATLIGTPPNIVFAAVVRRMDVGVEVPFLNWMGVGLPVAAVLLVVVYVVLTHVVYRFDAGVFRTDTEQLRGELAALGPLSRGEAYIAVAFTATALLWITRQDVELGTLLVPGWSRLFPHGAAIHDGMVAIAMSMLLFIVPVDWERGIFLMDRNWYKDIPWDIVMLFGGGFSLAQGFQTSGLSTFLGQQMNFLGALPVLPMMMLITLAIMLVTNLTSNTATTTVMLPILAATALATRSPPLLLMLPATFAASAAFMLPVGTPPNAIIFGSGRITIPEMMRAGALISLLCAPLIAVMTWWLGPLVLG